MIGNRIRNYERVSGSGILSSGCFRDQLLELYFANLTGDGVTDFFETRKVPEIRKFPALLRLDRLDGTVIPFEKNAFAGRLIPQRESLPIQAQLEKLLDEIELVHLLECRKPGNFSIRQSHLSRPATAGGATLAFKEDRHPGTLSLYPSIAKRHGGNLNC